MPPYPAITALLEDLLAARLAPPAQTWLDQQLVALRQAFTRPQLYLAFAAAPRWVGKGELRPTPAQADEARRLRPGLDLGPWTLAQTARTVLLATVPPQPAPGYVATIEQLFDTAEMNELVALYAALPLLAHPAAFAHRAAEGVRSNMATVFGAVALGNPYPAEQLDETAWNQMFLKAVFTGRNLAQVYGVDDRANDQLGQICVDYAHERWAAHRPVTPELWRPLAGRVTQAHLPDLARLFADPLEVQQAAAALVCAASNYGPARQLLAQQPGWPQKIADQVWDWAKVSAVWHPANG
jgi:hypothetical protein